MRFSSLLHGKLPLSPDSEVASCEERHGLIQGFRCAVGRTHREGDSQVSRARIGERHHSGWSSSEHDGIGQPPFSGCIRHGVYRRDDLADPVNAALPVSAVAAKWGLADSAHFSRVFRRAYGLPPGEFRRACLGAAHACAPLIPALHRRSECA